MVSSIERFYCIQDSQLGPTSLGINVVNSYSCHVNVALRPDLLVLAQDGRHEFLEKEERLTEAELKLLKTQDLKYVTMKLQIERSVSP